MSSSSTTQFGWLQYFTGVYKPPELGGAGRVFLLIIPIPGPSDHRGVRQDGPDSAPHTAHPDWMVLEFWSSNIPSDWGSPALRRQGADNLALRDEEASPNSPNGPDGGVSTESPVDLRRAFGVNGLADFRVSNILK